MKNENSEVVTGDVIRTCFVVFHFGLYCCIFLLHQNLKYRISYRLSFPLSFPARFLLVSCSQVKLTFRHEFHSNDMRNGMSYGLHIPCTTHTLQTACRSIFHLLDMSTWHVYLTCHMDPTHTLPTHTHIPIPIPYTYPAHIPCTYTADVCLSYTADGHTLQMVTIMLTITIVHHPLPKSTSTQTPRHGDT